MTLQVQTKEEGDSEEVACPLPNALARTYSIECSVALGFLDQADAAPAPPDSDRSEVLQVL